MNIFSRSQLRKLEKAVAPHFNTLAWKIPWMEEPFRLQSTGSLRVGHDWETSLSLFTFMHWRRQWQPTPVFLPGESQGGAWWASVYGVIQSRKRLKWLSSMHDITQGWSLQYHLCSKMLDGVFLLSYSLNCNQQVLVPSNCRDPLRIPQTQCLTVPATAAILLGPWRWEVTQGDKSTSGESICIFEDIVKPMAVNLGAVLPEDLLR